MTKLRTSGITVSPPAAGPKVRASGIAVTATSPPPPPKLRLSRIGVAFVARPSLLPMSDQAWVIPETRVLLATALIPGSPTADSWSWRQVSGAPAVTLTGTGAQRTFIAPSTIDGTELMFAAKAVAGGVESLEQTVRISILPQTEWVRVSPSTAWVGVMETV